VASIDSAMKSDWTEANGVQRHHSALHGQLGARAVLNIHAAFNADVARYFPRCQRREFLAVPEAAPGKRFRERRLIACTPEQLYGVVADVDQYKHFVPWCRKSDIITVIDDSHFEADLEVGFQLFSEKYRSRVTLQPQRITSEASDSNVFHRLVFAWEFSPGPTASTTWATCCVDYSFKNVIYMQTSVMFFDQVVSKMVGAFAQRTRQLFGKQ
jgi:coenzyme Q-binding protein COQ10